MSVYRIELARGLQRLEDNRTYFEASVRFHLRHFARCMGLKYDDKTMTVVDKNNKVAAKAVAIPLY